MPEISTIDIYCRTATSSPQDDARLEEQEQICRQYCAAQGLTVGMVHHESYSGLQFHERLVFNSMRSRYLEGSIQGVVVTSLDRLSRSSIHLAILVNEMEQHTITLHVVQDRLEDSLQGKWLLAFSAFLTKVEQEKLIEL